MKTQLNEQAIYYFEDSTDREHVTTEKIIKFGRLRNGWHYGEGIAFDKVLGQALEVHKEALRQAFFTTDAFPGLQGEVIVTIYQNDVYFEFTIEASGIVTFRSERCGIETDYAEFSSTEAAKAHIRRLGKELWRESGSLAASFTIGI